MVEFSSVRVMVLYFLGVGNSSRMMCSSSTHVGGCERQLQRFCCMRYVVYSCHIRYFGIGCVHHSINGNNSVKVSSDVICGSFNGGLYRRRLK